MSNVTPVIGLRNYFYSVIATYWTSNTTLSWNRFVLAGAVALLTGQFAKDPTTQYKDDAVKIIKMSENHT